MSNPAILAALVNLLDVALPNTQVINRMSSVTQTSDRMLIVGFAPPDSGYATGVLTSLSMNNSTGMDISDVMLAVSVTIRGTDSSDADATAWADFLTTVATIRSNQDLGIGGLTATVDGSYEQSETENEFGRASVVRFPVHIETSY